jgi:hypothetical protein
VVFAGSSAMSLTDVYRDRYYAPGYVYIAGSLSGRVIKIGTTINIRRQQKRLQNLEYGSLSDWKILYYVWVDEGGKIEHAARRRLRCYKTLRMYKKDGSWQKGREIV